MVSAVWPRKLYFLTKGLDSGDKINALFGTIMLDNLLSSFRFRTSPPNWSDVGSEHVKHYTESVVHVRK